MSPSSFDKLRMRTRSVQLSRLVDQHDRNAVADGIGELRLIADQLLLLAVVAERPLGHRTDQYLEQLGVDLLVGHGAFLNVSRWIARCRRRSSTSKTAGCRSSPARRRLRSAPASPRDRT